MAIPGRISHIVWLAGGVLALLVAAVLHLTVVDADRAGIEDHLQSDFIEFLAETEATSREILNDPQKYDFREGALLPEDPRVVRMVFDYGCRLVQWSNSERMPSSRISGKLCDFPGNRTIIDNNKAYYLMQAASAEYKMVTLVPVHIEYRIDNAFLPPYLFLGRYQKSETIRDRIPDFTVHYKQVDGAIRVFDGEGNFAYCIEVRNIEVFSYPQRDWVVLFMILGLVLMLIGLGRWTRRSVIDLGPIRFYGVWVMVAALLLLRWLLFEFDLPNSYRPYAVFSPSVLAISEWSPSLGDLMLNVLVLLATTWLLRNAYRRHLRVFFGWALQRETVAWAVQCVTLTICGLLTYGFFMLSEDIVRHSTIYFEFSNLFELTTYSYLAFGILAAVLIALQMVLLLLLQFSFHFFKGKGRWMKVGLSLAFLGGLSFLLFGFNIAYLLSVPLVFGLSLLVFIRTRAASVFRLDLLNFLILISIFSLLTTIGMVEGTDIRHRNEMERLADRQSDQHDLITESLFERVVQEVEAESYQLDYRDVRGMSELLKERFFDSNFKGYEVRIFIYDDKWNQADATSSARAYAPTDGSLELSALGRSTMTDNLFIAPYSSGIFNSIYIGQFDLILRSLGLIRVLVELEPTEFQANRLYPQLLLDDNVRSKAIIPENYSYAVYENGSLTRKHSNDPFPFYFEGPQQLDSLTYVYQSTPEYRYLFYKINDEKVVQVRTPGRSVFDWANLFSFTFYFFILGTILIMSPIWLYHFIREPAQLRHMNLKTRIQVFFLTLAILPLFVVVFLISPYIRSHIYDDLKEEVQEQTQQVQNLLRDDYLKMWRNPETYLKREQALKLRIQEMEKSLGHDINIYGPGGGLHLTTQPAIYELGLTSRYMDPAIYRTLLYGNATDLVVEEEIGNITYFSTFYPILSNEPRILGILNIPYYKNQDQVNEQSLSLLTLLVNIYVFIFMAIGVVAVVISNSIIRPLGLLNNQLRATNLGQRNEPIAWKARDEIGDIIQSYNDMLEKLAQSEEKLARNERETAWKEMARQVAHEIKNPLTPMRLSVQHLVQVWKIRPPENEKLNKLFGKVTATVLVQIEQLVNIANSFSQFAKMPEPQRTTFDLRDVVTEVVDLYSHDASVALKMDLPADEFLVHSDRDQLSRVFNNLIKNAKQAIEHEEGLVRVEMRITGDLATVEVRDNGKGIPEEIGQRVFEPRFSTKNSGMGLGLAMVRKIVESSGGRIWFETEVGSGTSFFVELPAANITE